jgi:hypothetical protein
VKVLLRGDRSTRRPGRRRYTTSRRRNPRRHLLQEVVVVRRHVRADVGRDVGPPIPGRRAGRRADADAKTGVAASAAAASRRDRPVAGPSPGGSSRCLSSEPTGTAVTAWAKRTPNRRPASRFRRQEQPYGQTPTRRPIRDPGFGIRGSAIRDQRFDRSCSISHCLRHRPPP